MDNIDWRNNLPPDPDDLDLNRGVAERFIEMLTGSTDTPMHERMIHSDKSNPAIKVGPMTLAEAWSEIETHNRAGCGAYVVINEGGDTDAEITRIRVAFIDGDNIQMPKKWHVEPSFIVARDDLHWHAYWLVADLPVAQFKRIQQRLARHYGTDPSVCNPSRVMRLPGTLHHKHRVTSPGYTIRQTGPLAPRDTWEIEDGLPELPAIKPSAADAKDLASTPIEKRVTGPWLDDLISFIDPSDRETYLVAVKVLGLGLVPMRPGHEKTPDGWLDYARRFAEGEFWGERIGDENFVPMNKYGQPNVSTYEILLRDIGEDRAEGERATYGSLIHLARQNGYSKPPDEPLPAEHYEALPAVQQAIAEQKDAPPAPAGKALGVKLYSPEELASLPPPEYLIDGLLPAEGTALLASPMGHYKTFHALDMALAVATNLPAFGTRKILKPGKVIYLTNEGFRGLVPRMQDWCRDRGISFDSQHVNICIGRTTPLVRDAASVEAHFAAVRQLAAGEQIALIVIDTFSKSIAGLDENSARDVGLYTEMADAMVREFGAAVLSIAHQGANSEKETRGSTALPYNTETVMTIKAVEDTKTATLSIARIKDWECPPPIHTRGRIVPRPGQPQAGLVFYEMPAEEARQVAVESRSTNTALDAGHGFASIVGATLRAHNIYGEAASVTREVLAAMIADYQGCTASLKDRDKAIQRVKKQLDNGRAKRAHGGALLASYFDLVEYAPGRWQNQWYLPEALRPVEADGVEGMIS